MITMITMITMIEAMVLEEVLMHARVRRSKRAFAFS